MEIVTKLNEPWMGRGTQEPKFKVGDRVDLKRWDASMPPKRRLGLQRVTEVRTGQWCESGVMVTITGYKYELDQGWLALAKEQQPELLKLELRNTGKGGEDSVYHV